MNRSIWPSAVASLLALGALLAVAAANGPPEDRATVARRIAAELRCPDCQSLSVAESQTRAAAEIRTRIDALLGEGRTADEVIDYFRAQYGDRILLSPTTPWPWLAPFAAVIAALGALILWRRASRPPEVGPSTVETDAGARRRVRDEAEALDA